MVKTKIISQNKKSLQAGSNFGKIFFNLVRFKSRTGRDRTKRRDAYAFFVKGTSLMEFY